MSAIYALTDPVTGEIRYVGKTGRTPRERLLDHVRQARQGVHRQRRLCCWIRSLTDAPMVVVLESDPDDLDEAERRWIATLSEEGASLCNMTPGGDGQALGYQPSEETLAKLRAYRHTPESRAKISAALKGRQFDAARRARISEGSMGKPGTFKGRKHTAESLARMSAAQTGHPMTEETKMKISKVKRARNAERRAACQ